MTAVRPGVKSTWNLRSTHFDHERIPSIISTMAHDAHHHNHKHPNEPAADRFKHGWKWALLVAVALIAIAGYVLSMDESLVPGAGPNQPQAPRQP